MGLLGTKTVSGFAEELERETGTDVRQCYQCAKCTAGCPTSHVMDCPPAQIMHLAQLGMRDAALKAKSIWLCVGCETCSTRCPKDLEPMKVMKTLCAIAARENVPVEDRDLKAFHEAFLLPVKLTGRAYEMGMMGLLKLRTLNLFQDLGLGAAMFRRGKLKPIPELIKGRAVVARMFDRERAAKQEKAEEPEH